MATLGTGVPVQQNEPVLTQPGGVTPMVNADALSTAQSWGQIAQAGARLADAAGDYAKVEIHQAKVGYLAGQDVEIARKRADLRDQFANDPQGFDAAWTGYRDGKIGAAEPWAVPHLTRVLGSEGNSAYSAILSERRADDKRKDAESLDALSKLSANDVVGSAMAGTLDTPDGKIKIGKFRAVLDSAVNSNLMTKEKADYLFDDTMSKAQGEIAARAGVEVYRAKGFDAAVEHLKSTILENEGLSLKGESRYKAFNRGLSAVRLAAAQDKEDKVAIVQSSTDLRARINSNQPYDDGEVRDHLQQLQRTGAAAEFKKLSVDYAVSQATAPYRSGLDLKTFATAVASQRVTAMPGTPEQVNAITTAAQRLGVQPADLAAAISYETGGTFDPNKVGGKGNNYLGLIQFGPEERQKYGVRPGMTFEQQMGAVEAFLRDRGVKPGMGISEIYRTINGGNPNAPLSASDGNGTIAEHIQRIQSGHYGNANRFLGGQGEVGGELPYAGEIAKRVQGQFVQQARAAWPDFNARIDQGKVLDQEDFTAVRYAAALSGDANWQKQVEELAVANGIGSQARALPGSDQQAVVDQARNDIGLTVADSLQKQFDRQRKMVKDDPVGFAVERFHAAPDALDLSSPAAAQATIGQRVTIARGVAAEQGAPAGNPFRPAETASIAAAITGGEPAKASAALDALAGLPDEFLTPALGQSEIKAAVAGAARSTDPARYTSAMQFLDRMWARSPETTKALFGEDQIHALMTWQTNLRYMTPEQLAKDRERAAIDPQVRERMKKNEAEGRELAAKYTFDDVAKQFDTSWWITPGPIARAIGSQPLPPTDALTRDTMMGDFNSLYARRYAETLDKDKAAEQATALMKTKWAASPVNGGRLMLNAPETLRDASGNAIYPAIDGKYDWMTRQIERDIGAALGKPMITDDPGSVTPKRNWAYTIVSDGKTQAEARAGQPASYQVVVTDADTGRLNVLPQRFRFDPAEDVGKRRTDFEQQRARLQEAREAIDAGPYLGAF